MKKQKRFKKEKLRRGIYVLPNLFTSINLFCGFYSIIASIDGKFGTAAFAILIAAIFDSLDGKIARATNTTSKFGVEYDSLSDLISFGLAPGLMMYLWVLKPFAPGRLGWLAAFLFMVCGALRLARFNSQIDNSGSDYFSGLPIPAGAAMNAVLILFCNKLAIVPHHIIILITLNILSFFMVSTIKYNSFKKVHLFKKMNFNVLVGAILILIFIALQPSITLFLIVSVYVLSGPVMTIIYYKKEKHKEIEVNDDTNNDHRTDSV